MLFARAARVPRASARSHTRVLKAGVRARVRVKEHTLVAARRAASWPSLLEAEEIRRARRVRAPRQVKTIMEKEKARGRHPLPLQLIVAKERARAHLHLQVIVERAKERAAHHPRNPPRVAERSYCVIRSLFEERIEAILAYCCTPFATRKPRRSWPSSFIFIVKCI